MQSINTTIQALASARKSNALATHPNKEGAPSFYRGLKEQTIQVLTTGIMGDTFYASKEQLAQEAIAVLLKSVNEDPEFLAKALVYARNEGLLRSVPTLGLALLSGRRDAKTLFESAFDKVILIPDDLREFCSLCKSGKVPGRKGLGGMARESVRRWLGKLSEYHTVKYGSSASREITMRDILRLTHPVPTDAASAERFGYLVRGKDGLSDNPLLNPQIRSLENLKLADSTEEQVNLIRQGRLPFEVVIPSVKSMTPELWEALLYSAPYRNLLNNLVTFTRHGVFAKEANVRYAVEKLTNRQAVEHSMVLPFRFFNAHRQYIALDQFDSRIADGLHEAMELSFVNMPTLGQRVIAIGTDVSGSMDNVITSESDTRYIDIAGIYTGALLRKVEDRVIALPFDTDVHLNHNLSGRDAILTTAHKIAGYHGGGTAVGAPIEYLLKRQLKVDVFIGITDNEDWAFGRGYSCSGGFLDLWRRYRKEVNRHCKAYLITIAPYRDAVAPSGEQGIRYIYGWSDRVLKYIALDLENGSGQIQAIEAMNLASEQS